MVNVIHPGLYTTIQDQGRRQSLDEGVPVSGCMDSISADLANSLLGNSKSDAIIEFTLMGPTLKFNKPTVAVCTGASFKITLDEVILKMGSPFYIDKDQILRIENATKGVRGYLAIKGGITSRKVLGSRSQYENITDKGKIDKGDEFPYLDLQTDFSHSKAKLKSPSFLFEEKRIPVYKGPEFYLLEETIKYSIETIAFKVLPQSNRMGIQLQGIEKGVTKQILTAPVQSGTIQMTPSGTLIVVMKDGQTTGGYPRILQLPEKSIAMVAQRNINDKFYFNIVDYTF